MALDFSLSSEQQDFAARARAACDGLRGWYRRGGHGDFFAASWEALAGAGLLGAVVPKAHGGSGAGLVALALALEELGATGLPNMLPILTAVDALGIVRHGTPALQRTVLPRVAAGGCKLCLAVTESEAGYNTSQTRTAAALHDEVYRLSGAKVYISGADLADFLLVLARSLPLEEVAARGLPKTAGLLWLLVDARTPGIRLRPMPSRGEGAMRQFEVELDAVEVPAENLLGRDGEGFAVLLDLVNPERILVAALQVGTAQHCLDVAIEHARARKVFGDVPIGSYQSIQHPLAEVKIRQEAVRLMVWRAAAGYDAGGGVRDVSLPANAAKLLASELGAKALEAALDTLGGKGFDERYGIVHLIEMVQLLRVAPISNALIYNQTAEYALRLPRSY